MSVLDQRPVVVLLDVDGVINHFPDELPAPARPWDAKHLRGFIADDDGWRFRITTSKVVTDTLLDLHKIGLVELQWLTTWGHRANTQIGPQIGWPELAVTGTKPEDAAFTPHLNTTSTRDESGSWWKLDVAREVITRCSGTRFIWIDDDISFDSETAEFLSTVPDDRLLTICPDTLTGLTKAHLNQIERFVFPMVGAEYAELWP